MQTTRKGEQCVSVTLPELLLLSHSAKALSLSAAIVKNIQAGQHLSRLYGRGMEFAECRRYQEGDDIRAIDWRVTARTGKVHTKLFSAEKERQVFICIDMRAPMFFATKGVFKSVQAALMASHIAWSAAHGGNRIGGMVFDEKECHEFRPLLGKKGVLPILHKMAESKRGPTTEEKGSSSTMDEAIQSMKRVATPGSLLFILSDFRGVSPAARDMLVQMSNHCDLNLCFLYDPIEESLPKNACLPVTGREKTRTVETYNKKSLETYQKQFQERKNAIESLSVQQRHIRFITCSTSEDSFEVLKEHFR